MIRALTLAALVVGGIGTAMAAETVAGRVFDAGLLAKVDEPATFRYRYDMQGTSLKEPFASHVTMEVRNVRDDGSKEVFFDMFEGPNRRAFGPMAAKEQNPLVLVFLQRDAIQMSNLTGGASGYFQQQLRRSFNAPATTAPVKVEVGGQVVEATQVEIKPFADDPNIERFPQFKDKRYVFVVTDQVPGGLYKISAATPDPKDGSVILEESMTFEEVAP
jgi:hypothetical protein